MADFLQTFQKSLILICNLRYADSQFAANLTYIDLSAAVTESLLS